MTRAAAVLSPHPATADRMIDGPHRRTACILLLPIVAALGNPSAADDPPASRLRRFSFDDVGDSRIVHLDHDGAAVGTWEIFDAHGGIAAELGFHAPADGEPTILPRLGGYRVVVPVAGSKAGSVVGHARGPRARAGLPPHQAFVYDVDSRIAFPLPGLADRQLTIATALSADGRVIAGHSAGVPCLWERVDRQWRAVALEHTFGGQPGRTQSVCLADEGKLAVASLALADGRNLLCVWRRSDGGPWERRILSERAVTPHDVNDAGTVVGSHPVRVGNDTVPRACLLTLDGHLTDLGTLTGDIVSVARSINRDGVVVGWSDAVGDPQRHPRGFVWKSGTMTPLEFDHPDVTAHYAYAINDRGDVGGLLQLGADGRAAAFVLEAASADPQH